MIPQITIETLPNEILFYIFSHLSWTDLLTSLWSLNVRFNCLVCSTLSINDNQLNSGLVITLGSSYNNLCSIFFPLILNSSCLSSSIRRIHFDETNSISCDLIYQYLFYHKKILHFPNLKSLIFTRCGSIESIVDGLSYLIEHQLDQLTLTFDEKMFTRPGYGEQRLSMVSDTSNRLFVMLHTLEKNNFRLYLVEFISGVIHQSRKRKFLICRGIINVNMIISIENEN